MAVQTAGNWILLNTVYLITYSDRNLGMVLHNSIAIYLPVYGRLQKIPEKNNH